MAGDLNILKNNFCYLIGSIEEAADYGAGWRKDIGNFLASLNVRVLNPCDKAIDVGAETKTEHEQMARLRQEGKFDELASFKIIRQVDLRMTDMANFTIFYLDLDINTTGSFEEFFWSNRSKKPSLVVCKQGKCLAPIWLFWCIPHEHIFNNFDELKIYLSNVDSGLDKETYGRWVFFDYNKLLTGKGT